jgi:hypothetical protein
LIVQGGLSWYFTHTHTHTHCTLVRFTPFITCSIALLPYYSTAFCAFCYNIFVHICHIFLNHSSVVGHLDYFQSLAILNSAIINMGVQMAPSDPGLHPFRYMPRSGITVSYCRSVLVFWGTSKQFSIVVALIYIPTNSE